LTLPCQQIIVRINIYPVPDYPERDGTVDVTKVIENPVSGEQFRFLPGARDAPGGWFRMEVTAPAGVVSPPRHIHRGEEECFEVLGGEVTVLAGRDTVRLRAGDTCQIPPGQAHTWRNSGEGPARMIVEFRPAGAMQSFFETFCGLARESACDNRGQPRLLQVAASMPLWQMYLAAPPIPLQQLAMAVLRPLARARGYRPRYPRFETPAPEK
jgi:mannose-6-phosphate isomerase-like protein (cupin superfamily)